LIERTDVHPDDSRDLGILCLTPTGRDAEFAAAALTQAHFHVHRCDTLTELAREIARGVGTVLVADEALVGPDLWRVIDVLRAQPAWSDVPVLVLTRGGDTAQAAPATLNSVDSLGNVTLLERPVRIVTLLSAVHSAVRARRRQYEVRDHLAARKRAEAEREQLLALERAARAEVEAANRAKDEFLAVLSHELRTPLQPILGWVKLLRQQRLDDRMMARAHDTIERNARAQAQIIEDLLDISRIVAGKLHVELRPIILAPVIDAAVEAVRAVAEAKSIRIVTTVDRRGAEINGDANRMQQVVWNLVSNALAFTPEGGRIDVSLTQDAGRAVIAVRDTGRGIAPQFLPQMFQRFRQADSTSTRSHGGLGLGLAIVRHLVEIHHGTVKAESPGEGLGAVFTVTLPLLVDHAASPPAHVAQVAEEVVPATGHVLQGIRVLVVDDDADTCELLTTVLGHYGAEVTAASSVSEALAAVECRWPEVLVSDIAMPGEDGYALVRRVRVLERERGKRLPALALTAHARASDTEQAYLAGFEAHVPKPVEPATLARIIARLARSRPAA
jgi:signal transduction histidine kinase/ActR/RegA family two-component response regulator